MLIPLASGAPASKRVLRISADPNNLPFTNEKREGFENKIAELLAGEMGAELHYAWRAQRRGFFRDGVLGFGLLVLLYAPWIPTLLFQAKHTGAPWAERPPFNALLNGLQSLVGGR